ncbi:hypothetical protein NFG33_00935 [Proteus mirabilis]|uniref:hypothetical protein n=1 Tax=Proteus TaxID=583 RepID=UPI0013777516|nr:MULTISPECIES: hypothetical protein [Proteus]MDF7489410.1 hypothetical protein [Proteus mirabilis]NBN86609.1 hypothetical protein [Proteus sp. G2300]
MKIEQSQVTKLVITDLERHDPIHVYLEDYGNNRQGRVTISEFGKSWSCYWGGMGMSLTEFLLWITNQYWIGCLDSSLEREIDADNKENIAFVRKQIIELRKNKDINEFEARSMFDDAEYRDDIKQDVLSCDPFNKYGDLLGDDPWLAPWPKQENPDYWRMESRLNAIREALKQINVN